MSTKTKMRVMYLLRDGIYIVLWETVCARSSWRINIAVWDLQKTALSCPSFYCGVAHLLWKGCWQMWTSQMAFCV